MSYPLLPAQVEFLQDDYTRNLALCGGVGSGKSKGGALKAVDLALKNPGHIIMLGSTDFSTARDSICLATEEVLEDKGIPFRLNRSNLRFTIKPNGRRPSILKTVTYGQPLVAFNAAGFVADELDTLKTAAARAAYELMSNRVRVGRVQQKCVTTTPEGFRFVYEFFVRDVQQRPELQTNPDTARRLIRASTLLNPFVGDAYIKDIYATRTPEQARAYIHGEFVNFAGGTVYHHFDRAKHHTNLTVKDFPNHQLWIGMDFNIDRMAAVVGVIDGGDLYLLKEFVSLKAAPTIRDTREMILKLKQAFPNRPLIICPDATGRKRDSAAPDTNLEQLRLAGFDLRHGGNNPDVIDRVNSVNALLLTAAGNIRLKVNTAECPHLTRAMEQQPWAPDDKPIKDNVLDDVLDAMGYLVWQTFPLKGRQPYQARLVA